MPDAEYQAAVDDAHRAIGAFVEGFSRVSAALRDGAIALATGGAQGDTPYRINILLGEATAQMLSSGFFALVRGTPGLSDADLKIANALDREIGELIRRRNDIAHGDWLIGYAGGDLVMGADDTEARLAVGREEAGVAPPALIRTKPSRKAGPGTFEEIHPATLDEMAGRFAMLERLIWNVCAGIVKPQLFIGKPLSERLVIHEGRVEYAPKADPAQ